MILLRKKYIKPIIEQISLDKEISLQLESQPPVGPDEAMNKPVFYIPDPLNLKYKV